MTRSLLTLITRIVAPARNGLNKPTKEIAVIVPLSNHANLTADEEISLRHLLHHLGKYDKFFIAPIGIKMEFPGIQTEFFDKRYFGSAAAHCKLLLNPFFYYRFEKYRYILFYHLDSLVFSDQLKMWCEMGLDYIGPPWIKCDDSPWVDRPRVGNGGFALLRVASAIKVLQNRYRITPSAYWLDLFARHATAETVSLLEKLSCFKPTQKLIQRLVREWREAADPGPHHRNNDIFWSDHAKRYSPDFKVATVEEGLRFAFEVSPRTCLALNGGRLPFGCHAWARYDREFWEPHLITSAANSITAQALEAL